MSLGGALQIGRSGLLSAQAGIEVAGNNLANIATRGYHRSTITLTPERSDEVQSGIFIGQGVGIQSVTRQINEALEARLRGAVSDSQRSLVRQDILSQIEAIQNEFTDIDVTTQLGEFFNVWSQLANNPRDNSLRSLVVEQGRNVADFLKDMRTDLTNVRTQVTNNIEAAVRNANDLLNKIEQLNKQIVAAEGGLGEQGGLRDQRGVLLEELAKYIDISTLEQNSGAMDVFVGSTPIILNGQNLGVETRTTVANGVTNIEVVLSTDLTVLDTSSGIIGALVATKDEDVTFAIDFLDDFTNTFMFEVNKLHAQGQGLNGYTDLRAAHRVADTTAALNDAAAELDFTPNHGSFRVSVTQKSSGQRVTTTIDVDLDGIGGNDTSLDDIQAAIDAISGISSSIDGNGRLRITSDANDFEFTFSDDTSGLLAALGVNTFFIGGDAQDIAVNSDLKNNSALLAAGLDHTDGDNRTALAIASMRNQGLDSLNGLSVTETWNRHVEDYAVRLAQARSAYQADTVVKENLESQVQQFSGVNADEETINLLAFQRAYQGSARFLSVVDEMMETLLGIV